MSWGTVTTNYVKEPDSEIVWPVPGPQANKQQPSHLVLVPSTVLPRSAHC